MPLINSMTCAGNLIGFNSGDYKALSHSLNTQVPFTETTLLTPRRCFERAVEKCYDDFLSSIVIPCSWGKHAIVGTRSQFVVPREKVDDLMEVDVYNFLHMVSNAGGTNSNTACLGEKVDDLMGMDEEPILILLGKKIEVDDLMVMDEEPILVLLGKK